MNSLCVVLMLVWLSNGQVTSSAIPINIQAGISLAIEGGHLDSLKGKNEENIHLRMALELSSGVQKTPPKALVENIQDDSSAATTTPRPTTTTISRYAQKQCKNSFIRLGDQCYYFSTTNETWHNALRSCMNLDADLVHPMSAVENSLITTHLMRNNKGVPRWWIGGTDQYDEGRWVWAHDKSPMTYTDWYESSAPLYTRDDCAYYIKPLDYKWFDNLCTNEYHFICQQRSSDNVFRPLWVVESRQRA